MRDTRKSNARQRPNSLKLCPGDNVAVALRPLSKGQIAVTADAGEMVRLLQRIPIYHKFALEEMRKGSQVTKYGEKIGRATRPIRAGEHVHTHNLASERGRGDIRKRVQGPKSKVQGQKEAKGEREEREIASLRS
ncbi:UxaA family hydrolase [Candidatus Poribacteria bacterium]|nr:UxaA family hydrolase [Candidatus Poribacteria bacterium]